MEVHRAFKIVLLLTSKSLKTLLRPRSYQVLWFASLFALFGGFSFMHYLMKGNFSTHLTSDPYPNLSFNFACSPIYPKLPNADQKFECQPTLPTNDGPKTKNQRTFSDLLVNLLYTGQLLPHDPKGSESMIDLLTSWMMNGLPLVGMDDFVYLSDWAHEIIDNSAKEELMDSPIFKNEFDNFINVRNKKIIFTPANNLTSDFIDFMETHSTVFKQLNYSVVPSIENQLIENDYDSIWAIIDLSTIPRNIDDQEDDVITMPFNATTDATQHTMRHSKPKITIRMSPGSVPDTRNLEWSPIRGSNPRQQSGELLYFTSGFLSMQLEIQNFLRIHQHQHQQSPINIKAVETIGKYAKAKFVDSPILTLVKKLATGNETNWTLTDMLHNISAISNWNKQTNMQFPFYHRAFPTHAYQQSLYWHIFGILMPIAFIVSFSLPAALAMGCYEQERKLGILDVLSTMPNIWKVHSFCAWNISTIIFNLCFSICAFLFFHRVLHHSVSWIPTLCLFLCSCSMGSIGALVGTIIRDADSLVLALPSLIFILTLPGVIYFEAAVDTERHWLTEFLLCLFPPSGAALVLRNVFSYESIGQAVSGEFVVPVSEATINFYCQILALDCVIYFLVAYGVIFLAERKRKLFVNSHTGIRHLSGIHTTESIDQAAEVFKQKSIFQPLFNLWTYIKSKFHEVRTTLDDNEDEFANDDNKENVAKEPTPSKAGMSKQHSVSWGNNLMDIDDSIRLTATDIMKQYTTAELNVTVLSNIDVDLHNNCVTVLLGSNGAGKTTLMKIIAGLDHKFKGTISKCSFNKDVNRRGIGWCPQNDALFAYLTVLEHVQLFQALFTCSAEISLHNDIPTVSASSRSQQQIAQMLTNVDLQDHQHKQILQLSGGMKRRLSLTLAFVGDPVILLLDEPTSGCDSWTRELLRKDILGRKQDTSILISTHHIDDIEVLAERIWFLNENHLEIDDLANGILKKACITKSIVPNPLMNDSQSIDETISFVTNNPTVKLIFEEYIHRLSIPCSSSMQHICAATHKPDLTDTTSHQMSFRYEIPSSCIHTLLPLFGQLEQINDHKDTNNWYLETPSLFQALTALYQQDQQQYSSPPDSTTCRAENRKPSSYWETCMRHIYVLCFIRWLEVKFKAIHYLCIHLLVPFLIMFLLGYSCQDAIFPTVEINSQHLHDGIGEICLASANSHSNIPNLLHSQPIIASADSVSGKKTPFFEAFTWKGIESSDKLWKQLYREYYDHPINRWGGVVVNDTIDKWLEITIAFQNISISSLIEGEIRDTGKNGSESANRNIFYYLYHLQQQYCNASIPQFQYHTNSSSLEMQVCATRRHREIPVSSVTFLFQHLNLSLDSVTKIHQTPNNILKVLTNQSSTLCLNELCTLHLSISEALSTNITLLSNVTTDHAAPIFLKEIIFPLYDLLTITGVTSDSTARSPATNRHLQEEKEVILTSIGELEKVSSHSVAEFFIPDYQLFSNPFPRSSFVNKNTLERGILGSTLMVMYMMIHTVHSVRYLISMKATGMKRQFHLAGMTPLIYLIGQYLLEVIILSIHGIVVCLAISFAADPVYSFFFGCPNVFFFAYFAFILAIVASNYAFTVLSTNTLSSQLLLFVTIITGGIFLKLYLDRHSGNPYHTISTILTWISPTFAFSTATFSIFKIYSQAAIRSTVLMIPSKQLQEVYHDVYIMVFQAVVYLTMAIVIDIHSVLCVYTCRKLFMRMFSTLCQKWNRTSLSFPFSLYTTRVESSLVDVHDPEQQTLLSKSQDKTHYNSLDIPIVSSNRSEVVFSIESAAESSPSSRCMIKTTDLCIQPSIFQPEVYSLDHVTLTIPSSRKVAIVGMNGGGKTTFFETCALMEKIPSEGKVIMEGIDMIQHIWDCADGRILGYVQQQDGGLLEFATMEETLQMFSLIKNIPFFSEFQYERNVFGVPITIDGILPMKFLRYPISSMSGGTKKKVAIRVANIGCPKVLMLDECTTGVDPIAAEKIVQYLQTIVSTDQQQGLLFSSHRIDELINVCEDILILVGGKVYAYTSIERFQQQIADYYQVDLVLKNTADCSSEPIVQQLAQFCDLHHVNYERVVIYSNSKIRLTFRKSHCPLSKLLHWLLILKQSQLIQNFSFRNMEMEEVLSIFLESTKKKSK